MPGEARFTLSDESWHETMGDYIRVSSKDGAEAMNRTMNNFAVFGFGEAELAQKGEIERVQTLEWWPKYVAKVMKKKKAAQLVKRTEKIRAKGKQMRAATYERLVKLHYTRAEAVKASASLIRSRSVSIGFVRFFFAALSRSMREYTQGMTPQSKTFKGFDVQIKPATEAMPSVRATVNYTYRRRGEKAVQKAEEMLQGAIDRARPKLINDMRVYIASKARDTARRFSI